MTHDIGVQYERQSTPIGFKLLSQLKLDLIVEKLRLIGNIYGIIHEFEDIIGKLQNNDTLIIKFN